MPSLNTYKDLVHGYRRLLISVGIVFVFLVLVIVLLPIGIQYGTVAWLEGDGKRKANIENVDFNPFTGKLLIQGLNVEEPTGRRLELPRVFLHLKLGELFRKRILFQVLELQGGFLEVQQATDGAITLSGLPEPTPPKEPSDAPSGWQIGVNSVAIERLQIRFHAAENQETINLQKLQIENLAQWQSEPPAQIETTVKLGDATLKATGTAFIFNETPSADVKLSIRSIDLARFGKFIKGTALKEVTGLFSAELGIQGKITKNKKIAAGLLGSLELDQLTALIAPTANAIRGRPGNTKERGTDKELNSKGSPPEETRIRLARGRIADLKVKLLLSQGIPETIELSGDTQFEALGVDTSLSKVAIKAFRWAGQVTSAKDGSEATNLRARGNLSSETGEIRLGMETEKASRTASFGRLTISNLDGELKRSKEGKIVAEMTVEAGLGNLNSTAPEAVLNNEEIRWKGKLGVSIDAAGNLATQGVGEFDSRLLKLHLPVAGLKLTQDSAHWKGRIDYRQDGTSAKPVISLEGIAETAGIRVDSPDLGLRLINLNSLVLDGIEIKSPENIHFRQILARGLETLQELPSETEQAKKPDNYVAFRGTLTAKDLTFANGSQVRVKQFFLDDGDVRVERLKNGELRLVRSLLNLIGRWGTEDSKEEKQDAKPLTVQVDEWTVRGNSQLTVTDLSVDPPAKFAIAPVAIRLNKIDTNQPEQSVPIKLTAKLGKYSTLGFSGKFRPFTERLNLDVAGKLEGFDLTSVSGYSREYMGYDLARGRMDADITVRIVDGKMKTDSKLTISKLQVQPTNPDLLDPMKKRVQVPVDTALSLLRDSNDVIRLNVPVTGDITSPKFDFSDAINTAIGNAMKQTVLTTLKVAFPLGGVIMTVAEAGTAARLRLNPISFPPGSKELSASARKEVSKVAELLRARPAVKLSICGWATAKDRNLLIERGVAAAKATVQAPKTTDPNTQPAGKEPQTAPALAALRDKVSRTVELELPSLAKHRGETVKDHLIKQYNVSEPRLFLCAPKIGKETDSEPRVDLLL